MADDSNPARKQNYRAKVLQVESVSPNLLKELYNLQDNVPEKLIAKDASKLDLKKKTCINNKAEFRFYFNKDQIAVEKLRKGILKFAANAVTLKDILRKKI
ncbi:unnamed protein product [Alternaria alternata]